MNALAIAALTAAAHSVESHSGLEALEAFAANLKLGEAAPFATLTVDGSFGSPTEVLAVYLYWDGPGGAPGRRRGMAVAKHEPTAPSVQWATSQNCPNLETVVADMEDIPPPSLNVPGVGDHEEMPRNVSDGMIYSLWARWPRWREHEYTNGYEISFSANTGNPLGTWAERLRSTLTSCWSSTPPAAD